MNPKLPPWKIFKKAVSLVWEKRVFALRIALPFVLFLAAFVFAGVAGLLDGLQGAAARDDQNNMLAIISLVAKVAIILLIVGFLACVVAVYWHRNILLQETSLPGLPVRFDDVTWRYLGYGIVLLIMLGVIWSVSLGGFMFLYSQLLTAGSLTSSVMFALVILLILLLGIVSFRMCLVLPAAAIGHRNFGIVGAWELSKGHSWQLLAMNLLLWLLGIVLGLVTNGLELLAAMMGGILPSILVLSVNALFSLVNFLVGVGLLSLTYGYLTYEKPQPEPPRME